MKNFTDFMPIIFSILFFIYIISLFIIRFIMKIKKDYNLENKIKENRSKIIKYLYIFLFLLFIVIALIFKTSFNLILMGVFLDSFLTSVKALKIIKDNKQKYYYIASAIFYPLAIITSFFF